MQLNEVTYADAQPIDGYGDGYFRVGGQSHDAPMAIIVGDVIAWGGFDDADTLLQASGTADFILIGTGPEIVHIPADLRSKLEGAGLGVEIMASAQACRTYNVLLGEGRRIALALLPV